MSLNPLVSCSKPIGGSMGDQAIQHFMVNKMKNSLKSRNYK